MRYVCMCSVEKRERALAISTPIPSSPSTYTNTHTPLRFPAPRPPKCIPRRPRRCQEVRGAVPAVEEEGAGPLGEEGVDDL